MAQQTPPPRSMSTDVALIVPVYNDAVHTIELLRTVESQSSPPSLVLLLDSSTDQACGQTIDEHIRQHRLVNTTRVVIPPNEFGHGRTRNRALALTPDRYAFILFMTQDAALTDPDTVSRLVRALHRDTGAACAIARQIARGSASQRESHFRAHRYPPSASPILPSNTCTLYRSEALRAVGGFNEHLGWGEDIDVGRRLIAHGWTLRYEPTAHVTHSHDHSAVETFRRYRLAGCAAASSPHLAQGFGRSGSGPYALSCLRHLARHAPAEIVPFAIESACRVAGYLAGKHLRSRLQSTVEVDANPSAATHPRTISPPAT